MTRKLLTLIACCLIPAGAAVAQTGGLTHVQLLALQQQLKEECGLQHATGVMDGPTRHAIAVCNKKYGTQGNGAALLAAMDVGFNSGDMPPHGMGGVMGNSNDNDSTGMANSAAGRARAGRRTVSHAGNNELAHAKSGPCRGLRPVDRDAAAHPVDSTSGGVDVDAVTNDRAVAGTAAAAGAGQGDNCTPDDVRRGVPHRSGRASAKKK